MNESNQATSQVAALLERADRMDVEGFLSLLDPDVRFRFGNAPVVAGTDALREVLQNFFGALAGLRHDLTATWASDATRMAHGWVHYTRQDGFELRVPFALVLEDRDGRIADYLIFVDNSELFSAD